MTLTLVTDTKWHLGHHKWPNGTLFWSFWTNRVDMLALWGIWFFAHWLIMGRSWKWPDLRSTVWKIRDIRFVDIDALTTSCKFDKVFSNTLDVTGPQTLKLALWGEVTYYSLVTWPGVTWCWNFYRRCKKMLDKVCQKRRRCAPLFLRYSRNARGG